MHDTLASSQDLDNPAGPGQEATYFQAPQNAVPANDEIVMFENELKSRPSLMSVRLFLCVLFRLIMYREPFYNIVTIKCGHKLSEEYKIDLALLCAPSKKQFEIFTQAEALHDQLDKTKLLKKRARVFYSLLILHKMFPMDNVRDKVRAYLF